MSSDLIEVSGTSSSGEVEFVLFASDWRLISVGLGIEVALRTK